MFNVGEMHGWITSLVMSSVHCVRACVYACACVCTCMRAAHKQPIGMDISPSAAAYRQPIGKRQNICSVQ